MATHFCRGIVVVVEYSANIPMGRRFLPFNEAATRLTPCVTQSSRVSEKTFRAAPVERRAGEFRRGMPRIAPLIIRVARDV
jgi:hypothetical protein